MDLFQISLPDGGGLVWVGLYKGQYPFIAKEKSVLYLFCAMSMLSVSECLDSAKELSLESFLELAKSHPVLCKVDWEEIGLVPVA